MARPLTTVWQHRFSALNPTVRRLGFVPVTHALAAQLIAAGDAQETRIGAFRFKRIDRTPLPPPVVVVQPTPAPVG